MDYQTLGIGIGPASPALAAAGPFASRPIAQTLAADAHEGLAKRFGAREVASAIGIPAAPAVAANGRGGVAGDVPDSGHARPRRPQRAGRPGDMGLDALVAAGLDRQTGRTAPIRERPAAA